MAGGQDEAAKSPSECTDRLLRSFLQLSTGKATNLISFRTLREPNPNERQENKETETETVIVSAAVVAKKNNQQRQCRTLTKRPRILPKGFHLRYSHPR